MAAVSQVLLAGADATAAGSDGRIAAHQLAAAARGAGAACAAGLIVNILLQHGARVSRGSEQLPLMRCQGVGPVTRGCDTGHGAVVVGGASMARGIE